jgi:hypothetical protein
MQPTQLAARTCVSCNAPIIGRYCSACGEETIDGQRRTVRHFVAASLLDEVVHLDSRFWITLRALLFKPGALTREFMAGRRRPYIGPVKLLLASIFVFAVATQGGFVASLMLGPITLSIAPTAPPQGATVRESIQYLDRFGLLERALNRRIGEGDGPSGAARDQFQDRIRQFAQPLTFGNVFFLSAGLFVIFRRKLPYYVDHLVFAMHGVTFVLISSVLLVPVFRLDTESAWTITIVIAIFAWQFVYLTTAIKKMYFALASRARLRASGVAVLIYVLNGIFVTAVQMLAGWIAILRL